MCGRSCYQVQKHVMKEGGLEMILFLIIPLLVALVAALVAIGGNRLDE